jgi:hypothetical protein
MTETAPVDSDKPKPWLILLLAIVVVGGATIWWISHRSHPAKDQAKAFIDDMLVGNLPAAQARCTPDVDFEAMGRQSGKMRFWGKMINQSLVLKTRGDRIDVDGSLDFDNLSKTFSATLMKQPDGTYKIIAYSFN